MSLTQTQEGKLDPMEKTCFANSLQSNHLGGALIGWEQSENGGYFFPEESLACCKRSATYFDSKADSVFRCDLTKRIVRVEKLFDSFYEQWGEEVDAPVKSGIEAENYFSSWLCEGQTKGQVFSHRKKLDAPGLLWNLAFMAAFRHNRQVVVVKVDKFVSRHLQEILSTKLENNAIICVEQVQHPNNPEAAIMLEEIIGWAYHSNTPLWLEIPMQAPRLTIRQIQQASLLGRMQEKMKKKANQSLSHWIDGSSFSRLSYICKESRHLKFEPTIKDHSYE